MELREVRQRPAGASTREGAHASIADLVAAEGERLEAEEGVAERADGEQQRDELRGDVERVVARDAADDQWPRERA